MRVCQFRHPGLERGGDDTRFPAGGQPAVTATPSTSAYGTRASPEQRSAVDERAAIRGRSANTFPAIRVSRIGPVKAPLSIQREDFATPEKAPDAGATVPGKRWT